ncbi:MAG: hypothetical protein AAGM84_13210 [Pseudomonadota bacterium]
MPVTERSEMHVSAEGIVGARANFREGPTPKFFNHMTAAELRSALPPEVWKTYARIGSIRNPFAIVLSRVFMDARAEKLQDLGVDAARARLERFVLELGGSEQLRDYFDTQRANVLTRAVRFEALAEDVAQIAQDFGLDPSGFPTKKYFENQMKSRHPSEFYSADAEAAVREIYRSDFEAFGYSMDVRDAELAPDPNVLARSLQRAKELKVNAL